MNFTSLAFLVFFPVVLGLYRLLLERHRWALLLCASWLFYSWWNPPLLLLLLGTTALTYAAGLGIAGTARAGVRRAWAVLGVGAPLLALVCVHALEGERRRNLRQSCLLAFLLILSVGCLWLLHLSGGGESAFLYFQF